MRNDAEDMRKLLETINSNGVKKEETPVKYSFLKNLTESVKEKTRKKRREKK